MTGIEMEEDRARQRVNEAEKFVKRIEDYLQALSDNENKT